MNKNRILTVLVFFTILKLDAQFINTIHWDLGGYFYPKVEAGIKEEGLGFYPVEIENRPGLYANLNLNKRWENGFFVGMVFGARSEGFDLERNCYTPLSNEPILDNENYEFRFFSFGCGLNGGIEWSKWRFSTNLLFNLTSIPNKNPYYKSNRGGNIIGEFGHENDEWIFLLLTFQDFLDAVPFGPNYITQEISVQRKIFNNWYLSISFEFQYPSDNLAYRYMANGSNYAMDTEAPIFFNRTSFYRKMEVLRIGIGYDLSWDKITIPKWFREIRG